MIALNTLILLSTSALMADLAGWSPNRFCVSGVVIKEVHDSDSEGSTSGDEVFYDAPSTVSTDSEDTETKHDAANTAVKTETPKPAVVSQPPPPPPLVKPQVLFARRTLYVPHKTVEKIIHPVGHTVVETHISTKKPEEEEEKKESDSEEKPKVESVPQVRVTTFGTVSTPVQSSIPPAPPLPPTLLQHTNPSVEKLLKSKPSSVPTYISFGRPSPSDGEIVSDPAYDSDVEDEDYTPVGYTGTIYAVPYDPKLHQSKFQKFKNEAKSKMSDVSKKVSGLGEKIKQETQKLGSHVQSKNATKKPAQLTEEEKYGGSVEDVRSDPGSSKESFKDSAKSKIQGIKDSTKDLMTVTSHKIQSAAHKTKKRTVSAGTKVKMATSDLKADIKNKASDLGFKLRGVVPRTKMAIDRLQASISEVDIKPRKSIKKFFKNKLGRSDSIEITHL